MRCGAAVGHLLIQLSRSPSVQLLGFAFSRDAARLALLLEQQGVIEANDRQATAEDLESSVLDLQRIAMLHPPFNCQRGAVPGLRSVAEAWLSCTIDKHLQCSDWDSRPLSDAQLQ